MIRATTPTHNFILPFSSDLLKKVVISYGQYRNEIVKKETKDCQFTNNTITVKLTQEETAKFKGGIPVDIQVRALTNAGEVIASPIYQVECIMVLNDEAMI